MKAVTAMEIVILLAVVRIGSSIKVQRSKTAFFLVQGFFITKGTIIKT